MSMSSAKFDTNTVALDASALAGLRRTAAQDPQKALRATAQQFETVFMGMLMKSMRDTVPKDGLFSSSANDMYTGMLDQQLSQKMSARGTGIADMIVKQLAQHMKGAVSPSDASNDASKLRASSGVSGISPRENNAVTNAKPMQIALREARPSHTANAASPLEMSVAKRMQTEPNVATGRVIRFEDSTALTARLQGEIGGEVAAANGPRTTKISQLPQSEAPRAFIRTMQRHAEAAERVTGVPAKFMMGQAALESGWGRREISHPDGRTAHNLFGIKAGSSWTGKTVDITTTEYYNGVPKKVVERFRAYNSYAESFRDYANLISNNPRYAEVIKRGGSVQGFANAMQRAGYATDPNYANKLTRTIQHMSQVHTQMKRDDMAAALRTVSTTAQSGIPLQPRDI